MHRDFQAESAKTWQFSQDYIAVARPTQAEHIRGNMLVDSSEYSVEKAWGQLRAEQATQ